MSFSLLWSVGFAVSIVVFAISIGLVINSKINSNKNLVKLVFVLFISTLILIYSICIFKVQLNSIIGSYNYVLLFLIAFLLMFIGYIIIKENGCGRSFINVLLLSYLSFILVMLICIGSKESIFGLDDLQISLLTTLLFSLLILVVLFACRKLKLIDRSYRSFGSLYLILGIYCLMISLLLPNIISLNMGDMKPINIVSIDSIAFIFILLIVIMVLGLLYYKKNTLLK